MGFFSQLKDILTNAPSKQLAEPAYSNEVAAMISAPSMPNHVHTMVGFDAELTPKLAYLLDQTIEQLHQAYALNSNLHLDDCASLQAVIAIDVLPPKYKFQFLLHTFPKEAHFKQQASQVAGKQQKQDDLSANFCAMMRGRVFEACKQFSDEESAILIDTTIQFSEDVFAIANDKNLRHLLTRLKRRYKDQVLSAELSQTLLRLQSQINQLSNPFGGEYQVQTQVRQLLLSSPSPDGAPDPALFLTEDAFAEYANAQINDMAEQARFAWYAIVALLQKTTGSKPTKKFAVQAKSVIAAVGEASFMAQCTDWVEWLIRTPDHLPATQHHAGAFALEKVNADSFKVLVWMMSQCAACSPALMVKLARRCYETVPGKGAACPSIGNACFYALSRMGMEGISQLSNLALKIKQTNARNTIENYLIDAADAQGMSRGALEDIAVADYGLQGFARQWTFKDYTATVSIAGIGKTATVWTKPDGKTQASVPSFVKEDFAPQLKELKEAVKLIEQSLTAQRDRLDRLLRENRSMDAAHFEAHFLNHGLMSYLAHRLIWSITDQGRTIAAIYFNQSWVDAALQPVTVSSEAQFALWHPAMADTAQVVAWREFMVTHELLQPFKQAYREIYLLTDAEINTLNYSNRMASHILKQHQFNTLAKGRGWTYSLLGAWDGGDAELASVTLEAHNCYAQYWVDSVEVDNGYNGTGIWDYVSTDQVRFINLETNEQMRMVDVPVVAFSEVMRDVDLFVGVASVGNDPNWRDGGSTQAHHAYWANYAFGDLSNVAQTRKALLVQLLPRLKLKSVATLTDKFLIIQGKLRTYKIHIGSCNILMEPNDQYLCIVPDRSNKEATSDIFLPFEGDAGLSLVLSKAFLLMDDDVITDPTIVSQIMRK